MAAFFMHTNRFETSATAGNFRGKPPADDFLYNNMVSIPDRTANSKISFPQQAFTAGVDTFIFFTQCCKSNSYLFTLYKIKAKNVLGLKKYFLGVRIIHNKVCGQFGVVHCSIIVLA